MTIMNKVDEEYLNFKFPVKEVELAVARPAHEPKIAIPKHMAKAILRTDTNQVLGVHGGKYNLVKHEDVVDNVIRGVDLASISQDYDHKITLFENGAKLKGSFIFNDITQKDPEVNDIIRFRVDYMNSYDGMWSIMIKAQGERLFCLNGCTSDEPVTFERNKHTNGFNIEHSADQIKRALEVFFTDREKWDSWRQTKVNWYNVEDLFKGTLAKVLNKTKVKRPYNITQLENLMSRFDTERNMLGETKWAVYNAATNWATHTGVEDNAHRAEVRREAQLQKMLGSAEWKELC